MVLSTERIEVLNHCVVYTPETKVTLHVNCTLIKKMFMSLCLCKGQPTFHN